KYAPRSHGADDYRALTDELTGRAPTAPAIAQEASQAISPPATPIAAGIASSEQSEAAAEQQRLRTSLSDAAPVDAAPPNGPPEETNAAAVGAPSTADVNPCSHVDQAATERPTAEPTEVAPAPEAMEIPGDGSITERDCDSCTPIAQVVG